MTEAAGRYRAVNWAAAGLLVYALLLPLISGYFEAWFPSLWRCPFAVLAGRPCPLCGLTRDFGALWRGDLAGARLNPLAVPLFVGVIVELLFRLHFCVKRRPVSRRLILADASVHGVAALLFVAWMGVRLSA